MPSASLVPANNMNNLVRDTYQANGLIRSHQQLHASSQTSLQKISSSSPKFMYNTNNQPNQQQQQQSQQQQHMQFPPPPTVAPMVQTVSKNDVNSMNSYNSLIVPQSQQQQSQHPNNINYSVMMPQSNGFTGGNHTQSTILMSSMMNNKNLSQNQQFQTQLQHQLQQQYQSLQAQQQPLFQASPQPQILPPPQITQQQQQSLLVQPSQSQPNPCSPNGQLQANCQQQVPMTTIMIPASAAAQLQSASAQIQQAAMQANATNPNQPQILVFMIPYMVNQPPTVPATPEHSSVNSTLVRQPLNQSLTRQSNVQPPAQQQPQHLQQVQQQQSNSTSHSRAVSSLSNATKQEPDTFYIKANFSYQATRNKSELSFQKGDILHVIDTLQNNDFGVRHWLATRLNSNGKDTEKGLIPNKRRAEEIAMEQRTMDIGGPNGTLDGGSGSMLSASVGRVSFLKRRAAQRSKSLCKDNWENVVFDIGSFKLPTYERVVFKHPGFCRPVVIFGPLSDMAREKLLRDYPEKYSYPTNFNQSPDRPKVIHLKGVFDVIDQGKHALLDITPSAVEKLNVVNLAPIVIFMKTDSKSVIKEFRSRAAKSLDPNARDEDTLKRDAGKSSRKLLEQSLKLEKTWFHVFTAVLDLSTMGSEMWYRKLRETIENQQSANVYMSEKKTDRKHLKGPDTSNGNPNGNEAVFAVPQTQSSASCVDDSSLLSERFRENFSIGNGTVKSTIDLLPDGNYGNRSQLRNAYAHSLAQKLARASSEPKLNGMLSDQDDDEDDDENVNNDDDDDDDDIIKKPLPAEFENSSSISSSNGAASYGQSSMSGSNMTYQHYPPPIIKSEQVSNRMQETIYARNNMLNSSYNNGNASSSSNYHTLPPMPNDVGYHNQSMNNMNNNVIDLSRNHDTRGSAFQVYSDMNQNNYHYYNLNKI